MRLLLAEDEKALSKALKAILERNNYSVDAVYDGQSALDYLEMDNYDGVILDIMMPKVDGLTVLRKVREKGNLIPILLLTAKSEIDDKVEGLDAGANDYLTKPFHSKELLARIRAITRTQAAQTNSKLTMGNVTLDRATFELSTAKGSFRLANKEFQMLELLMCNPRQLISSERFLEKIWGYDSEAELNVVWVYISYLRKKLSALHADLQIKATRNAGIFPEMFLENRKEDRLEMSPEIPYESRYFSVLLDEDGNVILTDTSKAIEYAFEIFEKKTEKGFLEDYRYWKCPYNGETRIIFLDCRRQLDNFQNFLFTTFWVSASGLLSVFVLMVYLSAHIVKPFVDNYEKQKRFITDAGHELKTPLTVIEADTEVLEMDFGENEWLQDIQGQTRRLADLTNALVALSRMEEGRNSDAKVEFPLSDMAEEVCHAFQVPAKIQDKRLNREIVPMLSMKGDEKAIRGLITILLDNAVKYTNENGHISVTLTKKKIVFIYLFLIRQSVFRRNRSPICSTAFTVQTLPETSNAAAMA